MDTLCSAAGNPHSSSTPASAGWQRGFGTGLGAERCHTGRDGGKVGIIVARGSGGRRGSS